MVSQELPRVSGSVGDTSIDTEKQHVVVNDGLVKVQDPSDPNVVDWDGPDDPANPQNWTSKKKWINTGLLASMTFVTPLASSMFAPGIPEVVRTFDVTNNMLAALVVSIYVLGYAIGPLVIAPLSEMYGRVIVYNVSNVLFVIFTIACAVASNMNMLIAFRFFAGTFGATPITIGGGSIADMFPVERRGSAMAIWSMGPLFGPTIGPVAGGFLAQAAGWRWIFWLVTILAGVVSVVMFIFMEETYSLTILEKKAAKLRQETGNQNLRSALALDLTPKQFLIKSIVRPIKMLMSPIVLALSTYMAFVYGILYLLFTTITDVFINTYGFTQGTAGLAYIGIGVGMMMALIVFGSLTDKIITKLSAETGPKPEYRLPLMIPATFLIPIGLFIYGWTAKYAVQWMAPIIGTGFVGAGMIGTFMPISTYLVDAFTLHAASAMAANTVLRSLAGALLPLAGPPMYEALGLGWGNSLLGFIALGMCPIPFLFWRYGERIRTSPRFQINF